MGLRTFLKGFLDSLLGEGTSKEFSDAWRQGYERGLGTADVEEVAAPQKVEKTTPTTPEAPWQPPVEWQQSSNRSGALRTPSRPKRKAAKFPFAKFAQEFPDVQEASEERPVVQEVPVEAETDVAEEEKRPLLCDKFLVKDLLVIDYVDKSGNATKRSIRTEEVYEYDDGVLVIRAWCHLRKDYRTFVSNRIQGSRDPFTKELLPSNKDLVERLKKRSLADPGNVAREIYNDCTLEIPVAIFSLMNYSTGRGYEKRFVSGKKKRALVRWVMSRPRAESLLQTLPPESKLEVDDILEDWIGDCKVTERKYFSCVGVLKRSRFTNDLEVRRQELLSFVEETLEGEGAKDTAVTRLSEDLLDPSFRIPGKGDTDKFLKEFDKVKQDSKKAKKRYKSKKKPEVISKNYRRYERGEPARVLAVDVALQRLQQSLEDENMLLDKQVFEERVTAEVALAFTDEELQDEGEMFRKRVGSGISTAYCAFGLRLHNKSWYEDSDGKSWLDLKTINS